MAYTYNPENIMEAGKDRMRFELGDTMTEGQADTTALSDEEIQAAIVCWSMQHTWHWERGRQQAALFLCRDAA